MQTILFHLLLMVLMLYSDANRTGGSCGSLSDTENNLPDIVPPGSIQTLTAHGPISCRNSPHVLLYRNQPDTELQVLYQRMLDRIKTPPIYRNTSGVYCVYRNCTAAQRDQCCIKVTVPTKMQITFPVSPQQNTEEYGSCIVSAWPRPPENETMVYSSDTSCAIKILSVRHTDTYTTAVYFKMYTNSSCRSIYCEAPSKQRKKSINTFPSTYTTIPTISTTENEDTHDLIVEDPTVRNECQCGAALGMYRTTLWIIVLIVFSITASL